MVLLVTGGSASGKSEYAENRALQLAKTEQRKLVYLATMMPFGEDAAKRIERHRQLRAGKGFETVERYTDIEGLCNGESLELENSESECLNLESLNSETFRQKAKGAVVMLECMSNLTANEMFSDDNNEDNDAMEESSVQKDLIQEDITKENLSMDIEKVKNRILKGIDALAEIAGHLVIVSINVFEEGMQQYDAWTQAYIQCLGELNVALTEKSDEALEVVYSIPVPYKEAKTCSL